MSLGRLRSLLSVAIVVFVSAASLITAASIAITEAAMRLPRRPLDPALSAKIADQAAAIQATRSDVTISSADGLILRGWLFTPQRPNGTNVLILHGQADNRTGVAGTAAWLASLGYTVLTPDARGHGENEPAAITYGVREAEDVRRWISVMADTSKQGCTYLVGQSMGAAVALQALPDARACGIVAESPFADFREIAVDRIAASMKGPTGFARGLARFATEVGFAYAAAVLGIDFRQASPARAVAGVTIPILIVHGLDDVNIPPRHAALIKASAPHADVWLVRGATHTAVWGVAPDEYRRRILAMMRQ